MQSKESLYQELMIMEGKKALLFTHRLVLIPDNPSSGKPKSRSMG
jgi:hypothetical protein